MRMQPVQSIRRLPREEAYKRAVLWFQKHEPFVGKLGVKIARARAMKRGGRHQTLAGLGAIDWGSIFQGITTTVKEVVPAALQAKQQKKVMELQLKRAEQGLPPLNIADYSPTVKIAPQITPDTEAALNRMAQQTVNNTAQSMKPWLIGGGLVLGVLLLPKLLKA